MRLSQLARHHALEQPKWQNYLRSKSPLAAPELTELGLRLVDLSTEGYDSLRVATRGEVALLLSYRSQPAALVSLTELESGELWQINQLQGSRSRVAYRIATTLDYPRLLGTELAELLHTKTAEVRHLIMPELHQLFDLSEACSQNIIANYLRFARHAGLRHSAAEQLYIADIHRQKLSAKIRP
jgi:hypothetical protein